MYLTRKAVLKSDMKICANAAGLALTERSSRFCSHASLSCQAIIISCIARYRKTDQGFVGLYKLHQYPIMIQSFPTQQPAFFFFFLRPRDLLLLLANTQVAW